jgi:excisionase family DNA binding protein
MIYYSTEETANLLGISIHTVRQWVYYQKIEAVKQSGHYLIPETEIERLKAEKEIQPKKNFIQKLRELF